MLPAESGQGGLAALAASTQTADGGRVDEDGIRCILSAVRCQSPDRCVGGDAGGPGFVRDLKCFERVGVNGPLLRFEAGVPG